MRVAWAALLVVAAFCYVFFGPLVFDVAYWVLGKVAQVRADRRLRAGVSIAFVVVYWVAVSISGSTQSNSTGAGATPTPLVAMATASPSAPATAPGTASPSVPSATPSIEASPSVTPLPSPTANPHDLTVANITQSLQDNSGLEPSIYQDFEDLQVTISYGQDEVDITVLPVTVDMESEVERLEQAGGDALIASRAIFGWYPSVLLVRVSVLMTSTDASGNVVTFPAVEVGISSTTAAAFNYTKLAQVDASQVLCVADSYAINGGGWNTLSTSDRGCLTSASKD